MSIEPEAVGEFENRPTYRDSSGDYWRRSGPETLEWCWACEDGTPRNVWHNEVCKIQNVWCWSDIPISPYGSADRAIRALPPWTEPSPNIAMDLPPSSVEHSNTQDPRITVALINLHARVLQARIDYEGRRLQAMFAVSTIYDRNIVQKECDGRVAAIIDESAKHTNGL